MGEELAGRVIDFLHDDKETLRTCALTHPTWLAASRFHLFNTITADCNRTRDRIAALDHPRVAQVLSCIRTVKIVSVDSRRRMGTLQDAVLLYQNIQRGLSESEPGSGPTLHPPTVHLCLGRHCNLGMDILLPVLSQISDKVTHLEFSSPILSHPHDLWPFISSFPNLRSLEVRDLGFRHYGDNKPLPQPGLKNIPLSKIRIDTMSMGFVIKSLLAYADTFTSLEEFGILYEDVRQTTLTAMAEAIQGNVKVLRFSASCHPGPGAESRSDRPSVSDTSTRISKSLPQDFLMII
jgi:hypothetical protein